MGSSGPQEFHFDDYSQVKLCFILLVFLLVEQKSSSHRDVITRNVFKSCLKVGVRKMVLGLRRMPCTCWFWFSPEPQIVSPGYAQYSPAGTQVLISCTLEAPE